jgi:predicted dehydrogenase
MNATNQLQWGVISTGWIAEQFALGLGASETGRLAAVGSRSGEKAAKFIKEFPTARAHGSYEELLADPEVEIVYVATPHPQHLEWAVKAAEAGKHILCEKPIGMNRREATMIVDAARTHDVFLMEAFSYRSHEQTAKIIELIRDGAVGEVRKIHACNGYVRPFEPSHRAFDKALGGGGILDVGCYPVSMVRLIAGAALGRPFVEPLSIQGAGHLGRSGVDEWAVATLVFDGDLLAQVSTSITFLPDITLVVCGTEGILKALAPWIWPPDGPDCTVLLERNGADPERFDFEGQDRVLTIEADRVAEYVDARQSPLMTWEDSINNMEVLDRWRAEIGLVYEADS